VAGRKFMLSGQLGRKVSLILGVLITVVFAAAVQAQQPPKFQVTASIWEYKSLCEFQDPKSAPFNLRLPKGSISTVVTGCMDIEKEHGHATAIRVLMKNAGTAGEEFQIGSLKAVILRLPSGKTLTPIAIRWPWNGPFGGRPILQFYTQLNGDWYIQVPAGDEINLVFLFEQAPKGASVQIGSMPPATVN
jgi:hypothetical protein